MSSVPASEVASEPRGRASLSRRGLFRAAGLAAVGVTVGSGILVSTTACSPLDDSSEPPTPDPLLAEHARARRDAVDAAAAATVMPDRAAALGVIAAERTAHADALDAEITRLTPTAGASTTPTPSSVEPAPPPDLDTLRSGLTESARSAADLARNQSGYRAGLLGSISAACSVEVTVLLA